MTILPNTFLVVYCLKLQIYFSSRMICLQSVRFFFYFSPSVMYFSPFSTFPSGFILAFSLEFSPLPFPFCFLVFVTFFCLALLGFYPVTLQLHVHAISKLTDENLWIIPSGTFSTHTKWWETWGIRVFCMLV